MLTDIRELAEFISRIENRDSKALKTLARFFSKDSFKKTVCFTGPAGVGKSTLIAKLSALKTKKSKLAWLACDPSSPKSGGSLLGDRIRISNENLSNNLFIRSLSTRSTSAFSKAIRDIEVFLEKNFDEVWVETAGSGQTQSEVARLSALTVLVLQPETGDEIQWMKSGVREWADLFFVHKADLKGADLLAKSLVEQGADPENVVQVSSKTGAGLESALDCLQRAQKKLNWKERSKILHYEHAKALYLEKALQKIEKNFEKQSARIAERPYGA